MAFRFNILADFYWESHIDKVLDKLSEAGYRKFFSEKNYGNALDGITVVLMCQDPSLNLKRRVRHSKKEKKIYLDIMLDLNKFISATQEERERKVVDAIVLEVPATVAKYRLSGFDLNKFELDLRHCMLASI